LNVKEIVPSSLDSAEGVCIKPICPKELYELPKSSRLFISCENNEKIKIKEKKTSYGLISI
jgi:hypothetical protein